MFETLRTALVYVCVLGILIFFHELGHYLAARARGVVVEVFSVGFGPALLSWRAKSGTVWKISVFPLGGYVKMQGWGEGEAAGPALPGSFSASSLPSKAVIVAAGPIANIVLAFVLFTGLFLIVGQAIVQPVLTKVMPGSPAAVAGLQAGDRVLDAGGKKINVFGDLQTIIVSQPDATVSLTLQRQGRIFTKLVKLGDADEDGEKIGHLGVEALASGVKHYALPGAVTAAAAETWDDASTILTGIYNLALHGRGLHQLAGPLGIAQMTGQVAAMGTISVISFIALLSINLGLVNLIPIPILDGGHLLSYAVEAVLRRPIPLRVQEIGLRLGMALILSLFFVTTLNDLTRMGAVNWVAHLFG